MRQLIFDCSMCAKLYGDGRRLHLMSKGAELTLNEWFTQCSGCGSFAVKIVDEALVNEL